MGQKCQKLFNRNNRNDIVKEFGAEQFFTNTSAQRRDKNRHNNFESSWLQYNNRGASSSIVPYRSNQSRSKRENFKMKLAITQDHLSQILRPAALATFLNVTQNPLKPPPPEILSQQSVEFSPIIVETLFSRVRSKPADVPKNRRSEASSSKLNQNQQSVSNHSGGQVPSGSKHPKSTSSNRMTSHSSNNHDQHVAVEIENNNCDIASNNLRNVENAGSKLNSNALHYNQNDKAWKHPTTSSFTVSPTADSIIISSQISCRKPLFSKNTNHSSNYTSQSASKRVSGIQLVHPSSTPDRNFCCSAASGSHRRNVPCSSQKDNVKCLSFHDSLPALNDHMMTATPGNHQQKISSLCDIEATSQSFRVTEV